MTITADPGGCPTLPQRAADWRWFRDVTQPDNGLATRGQESHGRLAGQGPDR